MSRRLVRAIVAVMGIAAAIPVGTVAGAEFHYVLVFGSQSHPKQLRYTHTWATFVKAVGEGPDPSRYALQVHTISWLPRTLDVRVWNPFPEPGVNLDLPRTLRAVADHGERVTVWGPFVILPELYERSLRVHQTLDSGAVRYRAISTRSDLQISDCIHAVAAVDPIFGRGHYPLIRIGNPASRFFAREIMVRSLDDRGIDQAAYDNAWLIPRLGLDRGAIEVVPPQIIARRRCLLCRCPE